MEKSDPVNGWPQRALSLRDMMMMMMMKSKQNIIIPSVVVEASVDCNVIDSSTKNVS
jgi:hypothetical protein